MLTRNLDPDLDRRLNFAEIGLHLLAAEKPDATDLYWSTEDEGAIMDLRLYHAKAGGRAYLLSVYRVEGMRGSTVSVTYFRDALAQAAKGEGTPEWRAAVARLSAAMSC